MFMTVLKRKFPKPQNPFATMTPKFGGMTMDTEKIKRMIGHCDDIAQLREVSNAANKRTHLLCERKYKGAVAPLPELSLVVPFNAGIP